jgi:Acetyltransferase (GNAT) domain
MAVSLEFAVKTTPQLTAAEMDAMSGLFAAVFHRPFPPDLYERKYARSCLGESLHCLALADGAVVGSYSAIPVRYTFCGKTRLFGAAVDLMLAPQYRGHLNHLRGMSNRLFEALAAREVAFVFGCAREEMRLIHETISKWRVVGKVRYYVAPLHVRKAGPAAGLLRGAVRAWNWFHRAPPAVPPPEIAKINDADFRAYRYKVFPVKYQTAELSGGAAAVYTTEFFYPIEGLPRGLRIGILLDVDPLTKSAVEEAVNFIRKRESQIDFLAYQGYLPFRPRNLLMVPGRFEKKAWYFMGRILRDDLVDARIFDMRRWNVNLSNGDLI